MTLRHSKDDYSSPPPLSRLGTGTVRVQPMAELIITNINIVVVDKGVQCSVGHGGALVEATTLNRRVVGSTPALAAM